MVETIGDPALPYGVDEVSVKVLNVVYVDPSFDALTVMVTLSQ